MKSRGGGESRPVPALGRLRLTRRRRWHCLGPLSQRSQGWTLSTTRVEHSDGPRLSKKHSTSFLEFFQHTIFSLFTVWCSTTFFCLLYFRGNKESASTSSEVLVGKPPSYSHGLGRYGGGRVKKEGNFFRASAIPSFFASLSLPQTFFLTRDTCFTIFQTPYTGT